MSARRSKKQHGKDYPPAWCQTTVFVNDSGGSYEDICCAYCGGRYTDVEHVIPFSWFGKAASDSTGDYWTWLLPSCGECNTLAGDRMFSSPEGKREYIQGKLRKRYAFAFSVDPWDDEEIDELGPNLRTFVRASQSVADEIRERVSYDGPLPPTVGSADLSRLVSNRWSE